MNINVHRSVLAIVLGCSLAAGAASTASAAGDGAPTQTVRTAARTATSLPVVDMAAVTVAAQVEGTANRPRIGDDASTTLVQKALRAKGYDVAVDGWFGPGTTKAYKRFQTKLGYSGIDANGLPGPTSLAKLGAGRFRIVHKVDVGSTHDSYRGVRVNTRTKHMLAAADALVPWKITLVQGSYCGLTGTCAKASKNTHDGGGMIDVRVRDLTATQRWRTVEALRTVGFAAWLRTPAQGFSPHIHGIAIGDSDLWQANGLYTNRTQVADYLLGKNGLRGHGPDNTPKQYRTGFTWWEKYSAR